MDLATCNTFIFDYIGLLIMSNVVDDARTRDSDAKGTSDAAGDRAE
jgi:hypothetical protein